MTNLLNGYLFWVKFYVSMWYKILSKTSSRFTNSFYRILFERARLWRSGGLRLVPQTIHRNSQRPIPQHPTPHKINHNMRNTRRVPLQKSGKTNIFVFPNNAFSLFFLIHSTITNQLLLCKNLCYIT